MKTGKLHQKLAFTRRWSLLEQKKAPLGATRPKHTNGLRSAPWWSSVLFQRSRARRPQGILLSISADAHWSNASCASCQAREGERKSSVISGLLCLRAKSLELRAEFRVHGKSMRPGAANEGPLKKLRETFMFTAVSTPMLAIRWKALDEIYLIHPQLQRRKSALFPP